MNRASIVMIFTLCIVNCTFCIGQRYDLNKKDTAEVKWVEGRKFYLITVEKGETMYALSKRFNVSQDEIIQFNPELKYGLKVKMKLQIPAPQPKQAVVAEPPKIPEKTLYHVGLLLPLKLWKNFLPEYASPDSGAEVSIVEETLPQLEFYEGALQAAEAMVSPEFRISMHVIDIANDTSRLLVTLKDPDLKRMDFIVAAGNAVILQEVNRFCAKNNIPFLTFALNASEMLSNNHQAFAFIPSSILQCREAGKFFAAHYGDANALVIKSATTKETERAAAFAEGWSQSSESKIRTLDVSRENMESIYTYLSKVRNNVIFIPSSNEDFVSAITTRLNDTLNTYKFLLVGIPTWQYFETIDASILQNLNTHLFSSSALGQSDARTVAFAERYNTDYAKQPSDAVFQGADAIGFIRYMSKGAESTEVPEFDGYYGKYRFVKANGIYENNHIYIYKYSNYELTEVK